MIFLRSLLFNTVCYGSGVIWGTLSPLCWLLPQSQRYKPMLVWVRFVLWCFRWMCGVRVRVIDHNTSPLTKPAVIVSKHQSTWETWFLQLYFPGLCTIVKRELLLLPFFGWGLALFRPITINRKARLNAFRQVKLKGLAQLQAGRNVLVFPEGTRTAFGKTGPYARSGAELAAAAGVPIVPVAHNAGAVWPSKSFVKYPGTITIVIGRPVSSTEKTSRETTLDIKDWIEGQIAAMSTSPSCEPESDRPLAFQDERLSQR